MACAFFSKAGHEMCVFLEKNRTWNAFLFECTYVAELQTDKLQMLPEACRGCVFLRKADHGMCSFLNSDMWQSCKLNSCKCSRRLAGVVFVWFGISLTCDTAGND